jgi:hypothetical protein
MSISSLTPPQVEKNLRRVRFSLPEAKLTLNATDKRTVHGTSKYINGTLINVSSTIHSTTGDVKTSSKNEINGVFKSSLKASGSVIPKEAAQYKVSLNIRPTSVIQNATRHSLPTATLAHTSNGIGKRRVKGQHGRTDKNFNTLPIIERKSSSLEDFDEDARADREVMPAATNLTRYKSSDDLRDPNNFKVKSMVLKLPEASVTASGVGGQKSIKVMGNSNTLKVPDFSESESIHFLFTQKNLTDI